MPSNVSNLVKRKGMPAFGSLAEADAWRAVHAPARKAPESSAKIRPESREKSPESPDTTTRTPTTRRSPTGRGERDEPPERIDVATFVDKQTDFDALMIEHAEELPQIAFGLYRRAAQRGEPGAISAATKNWHEASKAAADVREKFVALQKETRALIPIDDVEDVVATELREVAKFLRRLGLRCAPAANPADPAQAQRAIDAAVDELLGMFTHAIDRTKLELEVAKETAPE